MKKRTKRILAMLLASAMILQQGSTVGVLATETEPVSETVAETQSETTAETQAPETTAETKAPETQATEDALGTPQTDADAAQTEQSETVAATQTEQSETAAAAGTTETATETTESAEQSETTAQETTEAPAQTGEKTEAPTEAVTEKETEVATEASKTNSTYKTIGQDPVATIAADVPMTIANGNVVTSPVVEFKQVDESGAPTIASLQSGEDGFLYVSLGLANDEDHQVESTVRIDLGKTNAEFPDFINGEYTANGITYYLREDADGNKYIEVAPGFAKNGTTLTMKFRVAFPNGVCDETDSITAQLKVDGTSYAQKTLGCTAEPHWKHQKQVDLASVGTISSTGEGEGYVLQNDITYTLHEYCDEIAKGNIWIDEYTITDTLTFPAGMYVPSGTNVADVLEFGSMDGVNAVPIEDGGKITGYTITYTVKREAGATGNMPDHIHTVKLKKASVKLDATFTEGKIENKLHTTYKTVKGKTGQIDTDAVAETLVKLPGKLDFEDDTVNKKEVSGVADKTGVDNYDNKYVVFGDYILYKVQAKNNGGSVENITIVDDLSQVKPEGSLTLPTVEELLAMQASGYAGIDLSAVTSLHCQAWLNNYKNEDGGKFEWNAKSAAKIEGNKITWEFNNIEPDTTVEGYVILKVNTDAKASIVNEITINDTKKTVSVEQHEKEEELEITKTAETGYEQDQSLIVDADGTVWYTITISNKGTDTANNWNFEDVLPDGMEIDNREGKEISVEPEGKLSALTTVAGTEGSTTLKGTLSNLAPKEKVTIKVPLKLKKGTTETSFTNTARVWKEDVELKAGVTVKKNEQNIGITKKADKTSAHSGEKIKYTIEARNNGSTNALFTDKAELVVWDVPEGLIIKEEDQLSQYFDCSGGEGITVERSYERDDAGNITKVKFTITDGKLWPGHTVNLYVWGILPEYKEGMTSVGNTAYVDGKEDEGDKAEVEVKPPLDDIEPSKKVYREDGSEVTENDPIVTGGETVTYRIVIENKGTTPINKLTITDTITGNYEFIDYVDDPWNNRSPGFLYTVETAEGVTGINEGDTFEYFSNGSFGTYTLVFTNEGITNGYGDQPRKFYVENFSIAPGGKLVLSYRLKLKADFKTGRNNVDVNGHEASTVQYATELNKVDVEKHVAREFPPVSGGNVYLDNAQKYFTIKADTTLEDLLALRFKYAIVLRNYGASEVKQDFTVTDTLPAGFEYVEDSGSVLAYQAPSWTWKDTNLQDCSVTGTGSVITANVPWLPANKSVMIFYQAKLTQEKAEQILAQVQNDNDELFVEVFTNSVVAKSDVPFKDGTDKVVKEVTDKEHVTLEEETTHITFEKYGEGSYADGNDGYKEGSLTTVGGTAGSVLVWKLVVRNNKSEDGQGAVLQKYTIEDTLPEGYEYYYKAEADGKNPYPASMIVYDENEQEVRRFEYFEPSKVEGANGIITWKFDSSENADYALKAGEHLVILFATKIKESEYSKDGTYVNYAKLTIDGEYAPGTEPNPDDHDKEYDDTGSITLASTKTTSVKTIEYEPHPEHKHDPEKDKGQGDKPMPDNYVQGMQGEDVKYTLNVTNANDYTKIANMVIIDRLPYVGDIGVIAPFPRNSAFDVDYDYTKGFSVAVGGNDCTAGVKVQFSDDRSTVLGNSAGEWSLNPSDTVLSWHDSYQTGDTMIRFEFPKDFILGVGETVTITFYGRVPEIVDALGKENIAWNNFAYSYTSEADKDKILIAEPAKVGVWVEDDGSNGKITVEKKYIDATEPEEKTFYFAVFEKAEDGSYTKVGSVKSVTLTGSEAGEIGEVTFEHLPYDQENGTDYYIFETDENGVILGEGSGVTFTVDYNGEAGPDVPIKLTEEDHEKTVQVTNTEPENKTGELAVTKLVANNSADTNSFGIKVDFSIGDESKIKSLPEQVTVKDKDNIEKTESIVIDETDATNPDIITKGHIVLTLKQNETLTVVGLAEGIRFTVKEINLPDGRKYVSTLDPNDEDEGQPSSYTGVIGQEVEAEGGELKKEFEFAVTVTNTEVVEKTVTKVWSDSNNENGNRPESIEVQLNANDTAVAQGGKATLNAGNNWSYTWDNLPKYNETGDAITYTVTETAVSGYAPSYSTDADTFKITNTETTTEKTVTKEWDDNEGVNGNRTPIIVRLLANEKEYGEPVTLNAANGWTYTWENLPTHINKKAVTYTVKEIIAVPGYTTSYDQNTLTITNKEELTSTSVTKVWEDEDDQDHKRPGNVQVQLLENGTAVAGSLAILSEANSWSHTWPNLPKYKNGTLITYTVEEVNVPEGYHATVTPNADSDNATFTITNTHTPGKVSRTVKKVWEDNNNQDGLRPESIQVQLLKDGTAYDVAVTLNESNSWSYTWTDLDEKEDGRTIEYTVQELGEITGYTTAYSDDKFTITNTHTPAVVKKTVTKVWADNENQDGIRPASIGVELLADGKSCDKKAELNAVNGWTYTWTDLPKNANGEEIKYTVVELSSTAGYTTTYDQTSLTITNSHTPDVVEKTVTKVWADNDDQDGKRPTSVTVQLLADGKPYGQEETLDESNDWTHTWTNLPKKENGNEIIYTVQENAVTDYSTGISAEANGEFVITNTYTPGLTSRQVQKVWKDNNDQDGLRLGSIRVQLYADNEPSGDPVELNEGNGWSYTWPGLDEKKDGKAIVYKVQEIGAIAGYTTTYSEDTFTITNTHTPATTKVSGTKTWADEGSEDKRPKNIEVVLQSRIKDATPEKEWADVPGKTLIVEPDAAGKWAYSFDELPVYEGGKELEYRVRETEVPGYVTEYDPNGKDITNTITSVSVSKVDVTTQEELEGAHIQILDEEGNVVAEWDSTTEPHEVTGLKTGKKYTLRETVAPDGYEVTTDTEFTLKADGTIDSEQTTTKVDEDGVLLVEDDMTSVKISKVDVTTQEELEGAHIQILDEEGNVVAEWDSTKEPHEVKGLKTGKKYTLRETVAPNEYTVTTDTEFTLKADGTIDDSKTTTKVDQNGVFLVEDSLNAVSIEKVDESGAALSGAKLVIKDADSAVVDSWTTDGKAHDITGLAKGKYTLSEVEAPEGYEVSKDVPFEITGTEKAGEVLTLTMTDTKTPDSNVYSLTVTKHLRLDGVPSELAAKDVTYYVALFSDAEKTQRVSNVKKIEFHNATSSAVTFDKLAQGTYYVGETDENGTLLVSKIVNDEIIFYPEYTGDGKVELEGRDTDKVADFTNVYMQLTDDLYLSGQITVTKKILVNGEEGTSDETYYARLFTDPELTDPLDEILALDLAGNSSASATVTNLPIGETLDSTTSYYVAETDEYGNVLDPDAVTEFEISIDKSEIVLSADNSAQEVVITNSFTEEETETETETEVPKKAAPKTGDDTDYMRYLLLMALSAGICAVAFEEKRRRSRARK